jgi:hypothetical protein
MICTLTLLNTVDAFDIYSEEQFFNGEITSFEQVVKK